jgi:hypothetical protein
MAKRIEGNEIINDSWAAKAVKQGEDLLKVLEKLEEQGKQTADQLSKVAKTQSGATAKSIRDITQAVSKSNAERKKSIAIDNEKKSLEEKLTRLRSNRIQQNEELKVLISEQRKVNKQLARETTGLAGAYEKESKTLIKLRKQLKDLIITEGEGSKKTQQLKRRVTELDQKLKSADAAAGQFQRNVGNYPKAMGGAIASLKKFAGALGIVGGVQLLNRGLRNTFDIVKNFDQAQANLASVLGVTRDEMSGLTEMAKELGATTKFTAAEVSELQLEFAKLGFTQKEIEGVTEATLQLAAAAGTDLANAASIVGSTLRGFGLDVTETQRLVDVMAKSFSSSSLDIDKFSSAMSNVAPAASAIGLTVEETTALLGSLTDAGIDASSAGTGLRNMFLLAKEQGITFDEALDQIANSSDQLGTSFDLFKKKGSTLGVILANSRDKTNELTQSLKDSSGAAEEMADKQLDTLQGSLELLNSAWEGYILGADGAGGVSESLKNIIKFLADNFKAVAKVITGGLRAWALQKLAVKLFRFETNAAGKSVAVGLIPSLNKARKALLASVKAFKIGAISAKGFGTALKSIPFVGIISGIATVASLFFDLGDEVDDTNESMKDYTVEASGLNKVNAETSKQLDIERASLTNVFNQLKATTKGTKERKDMLDKVNKDYGLTLENLSDEAGWIEQLDTAYNNLISTMGRKIRFEIAQEEINKLLLDKIKLEDKILAQGTALENSTNNRIANQERILEIEKEIDKLRNNFVITGDPILDEQANRNAESAIKDLSDELAILKDLGTVDSLVEIDIKRVEQIDKKIKSITDSLKGNLDLETFTPKESGGGGGAVKNQTKAVNELSEAEKEEQIQWGIRQQRKLDQQEQEKENLDILAKAESDRAAEIKRINDEQEKYDLQRLERQKELEKEIQESIKKTSEFITQSIQKIADLRQKDLDMQIEASQEQISKSQNEVARLQEIGTAQAIKSAEAEQRRIDKETAEIEDLEKKKRNLLIVTTGLERVNQLIQQGNSNPFQTTGGEIGNFISQLASFYDGTELTVADSLGKTGTKDGHIVRVHDNEHIVSAKDSDRLHANGIYKTSDIVDSALNWKNLNTSSLIMNKRNNDAQLISEIKEMRKAFNSIDFPEQYVYLDRDVFKKQNSIKTVTHSNNRI